MISVCLPSRGPLFGYFQDNYPALLSHLKTCRTGFSHTEVSWAWAIFCYHLPGPCAVLMSIYPSVWLKRPGFNLIPCFCRVDPVTIAECLELEIYIGNEIVTIVSSSYELSLLAILHTFVGMAFCYLFRDFGHICSSRTHLVLNL